MKRKHVIATFALSALMGIGVFAGVRANKVKEAKADTVTMYLSCPNDVVDYYNSGKVETWDGYWGEQNYATLWAYCYGTSGSNADWPGQQLTAVEGASHLYKLDISDAYTNVIFTRWNYDHTQIWSRNTWDGAEALALPADWTTQNMFTITKFNCPTGNDSGSWSLYEKVSVDVYVNGAKRGTEQITKGGLPTAPTYTYGQGFSGWYDNAEMTEGHEVHAITEPTSVWGAVNTLPTVTYKVNLLNVADIFVSDVTMYAYEDDGHLKNAEWPGVAIANDEFTVPNDATIIIAGKDGESNAVQTVNVTQSGVANDVLRVLPDQTGTKFNTVWESELEVPVDGDGYYIVGTQTDWKFEGATKLDAGQDGNLAQKIKFAVLEGDELKVRKYQAGYQDVWYGVGEGYSANYVADADKEINIYINGENHLYIEDYQEIPAEEGYYICGLNGWDYEGATKMVAPSTVPGNVAHYMGLEAEVDDEIRVRSYYDDRTPKDQWAACGNGEETYGEVSGNNFKFTKAGIYDIYAYYEEDTFKFFVAEHVDSYTVEMTGVNFNGKAAAGTISLADQTAYSSANFEPEVPIQNGYVARGVYEDEACTTAYTPKIFDAAGHLYVKYTKIGVYMVGDDTFSGADLGWTVDGATILPAAINDIENNLYEGTITITGASVQNPVEVRPANYTSEGTLDYSMEYSLGVAYDFAKKVGNNIQFTENGTFAVYFNKSNQIYLNKGADAFYTKFLTEVGGICDPEGDTNLTNLASVWAAQEDAFNSLSKTERDAIKAVGFDGGDESGDDLHKVIAKYHYILTKYGTAVLNDFIFNQINIEANVNTVGMTADDTTMTVVVISAIAVISAAGLFFLIRRKRHLVK